MKTEKFIQLLSNNRKLIAGPCKKQFFLSFHLFYYIHTPVPPLSQANQSDGNSVAREVGFDHHLTTPSSPPVLFIVFTLQQSFITSTNSAGSCAYYTISGALSCYFPVRHSSPTRLLRPTTLLPQALGVTIFFRAKYISIFHLFFSIILHDSKPLLINDLCAFWFFPVNSDIAAAAYPSILACLLFMCYSKRNKESRIVASHDLIAHLR